jgi:hypothetical protein
VAVPVGSRFKGYEICLHGAGSGDPLAPDPLLRWLTPEGQTVTAPLPAGITGHCGAELRRFILAQYRQRQVTVRGWSSSCVVSAHRFPSAK